MALGADLVLETVNAPGTATFSLAGTSTGRRTFVSGFGTGVQVYYTAHDGSSWEIGYGTVTSGAPNTLSRDTVIENSLGTTAKINFTTSTNVYADIPSKRKPWASADNSQMLMGTRRVSGLVAGTAVDDAPRLDQMREQVIGSAVFSTAVANTQFTIPAGFRKIRVDFQNMVAAVAGAVVVQLGFNGGALSVGATDYQYDYHGDDSTSGAIRAGNTTNALFLCPNSMSTATPLIGDIEIDTAERLARWRLAGFSSTGTVVVVQGGGRCGVAGTLTKVSIGYGTGNTTRATITLTGFY